MNYIELLKEMGKRQHIYSKDTFIYFFNKRNNITRVLKSNVKELESLALDNTLYVFDGNGFVASSEQAESNNIQAQIDMFDAKFEAMPIPTKILKEVANFRTDNLTCDSYKHLYLDKGNNRIVATSGYALNLIQNYDLSFLKDNLLLSFNLIAGLKESSLISYTRDENGTNYKIQTNGFEHIVTTYNFNYCDIRGVLNDCKHNVIKLDFDLQNHKFTKKEYLAYNKEGRAGVYLLNSLTKKPDENNHFIKGIALDLTKKLELGAIYGEKIAELMEEAESLWIYDIDNFYQKPILVKYKDNNKVSLVMPVRFK